MTLASSTSAAAFHLVARQRENALFFVDSEKVSAMNSAQEKKLCSTANVRVSKCCRISFLKAFKRQFCRLQV